MIFKIKVVEMPIESSEETDDAQVWLFPQIGTTL